MNLRFASHRHTGHQLHRRHTSYPTLVMILLCVGVFLVCWTRFVSADPPPITNIYTVNASVPGPAPTVAATIDAPSEGATFSDLPIDVSGTCPLSTYVTLYRNGAFSGTSLCQADGTWQIQSGLFVGANQLQARVFSLTDLPGPLSNVVNVTFTPPTPPPGTSGGGTTTGGASGSVGTTQGGATGSGVTPATPLIFKTDFRYRGHYTGQPTNWRLDLEGGVAPYAISVDWGDGTHDLVSRPRAGIFSIDHTYKKAGAYRGSYVVKFSASDSEGNQTFLQLLTIVNDPPAATGTTTGKQPPTFLGNAPDYLSNVMQYIWPGYAIVLLMLLSFWLGERREYRLLKPRLKKAHHA